MIDGDARRFWEKVEKREEGQCWEWTGATKGKGYGHIKIGGDTEGAHRVAYALENGDPGDRHVLHECDNPACVNPEHLYLGSHSDNMQDMWDSGLRNAEGENNPFAKLTVERAKQIQAEYQEEEISQRELGERHGLSQATVSRVVRGVSFTDAE